MAMQAWKVGGGAVTNQPCYHNKVPHGHIIAMIVYPHGWYHGIIYFRETYPAKKKRRTKHGAPGPIEYARRKNGIIILFPLRDHL